MKAFRWLSGFLVAGALFTCASAQEVKIGVLGDMSGATAM